MPEFDKEAQKELIKEAFKEWLDSKVTEFGWFAIKTMALAICGGLLYVALISQGWKK